MDHWSINYISTVPLHEQLQQKVIKSVRCGELTSGRPLPSIKKLSRYLSLSESITSKAYRQLLKEGVIKYAKGAGYCVAEKSCEN